MAKLGGLAQAPDGQGRPYFCYIVIAGGKPR